MKITGFLLFTSLTKFHDVNGFAPMSSGRPMENTMLRSTEESKTVAPEMSLSLPFMERPSTLTGAYAGDVGFDPVGFSKTEPELKNYREAEIKHSRLAMLAAAGWPISEILDKKIAGIFNLSPLVDGSDRVPSVLNGGLGQVSPIYWAAVIALASGVEIIGLKNVNDEGYTPGDYKFDPLGLYPSDEAGQMSMQLAEIKHGRLAMIAITAFAVQEAVSKLGVVDETPFFFRPITYWGTILHDYANSGYISN